ncbi:hypothetical protein ACFLYE_01565 [Chloroflexota bacterium]
MKFIKIFVLAIALIAPFLVPASVSVASQSELVETVIVPASSITPIFSINSLQNGAKYILKASGTWRDTSQPNHYIDAEYTTFDGWITHIDGTPNWGPNQKDLMVDNTFVDWGNYNLTHEYELYYTGSGARLSFMIIDKDPSKPIDPSWYADNVGSLKVEIYECALGHGNNKDKGKHKPGHGNDKDKGKGKDKDKLGHGNDKDKGNK